MPYKKMPRKASKMTAKKRQKTGRAAAQMKARRRTPKVSKNVKAYVKKAVDAATPDMRLVMYNPEAPIKRPYNGTFVGGSFNDPPRTDVHFFLHNQSSASYEQRAGMNIPEQIGLRHLENRLDLDNLRVEQVLGTNVKLKNLYVKGRYVINQAQMETLAVPEIHIRTMVLQDREKSYEELLSEFNTPLYESTTSNSETNPKAGILYKMFRDPSGYTVVQREDQESSGYLWPHASRMCRQFPDDYSMNLPLNTAAFKYLGGVRKKVTVGNWKPVYDAEAKTIKAVAPSSATYVIPFSFKIKHPSHLRWDNSHRRMVFRDITKDARTPGPQNFTPFLVSFVNSPNDAFHKVYPSDQEGQYDKLVQMDYTIYATIEAKPHL